MDKDGCCQKCIAKCSDCSPKPVTNETLKTFRSAIIHSTFDLFDRELFMISLRYPRRFTHADKGECVGKVANLNECSGYCSSSYNVGWSESEAKVKCTCCKPSTFSDIMVFFKCDKGFHTQLVKSPLTCECSTCNAK